MPKTEIAERDGAQWMMCTKDGGLRHGPFQICLEGHVTKRGQYADDKPVGVFIEYREGRTIGTHYFSRGHGVLGCSIEGGEEHCEFTRMGLPCKPEGLPEHRVFLVESQSEFYRRLGCSAAAEAIPAATSPPIDWSRYRVALVRIPVPDPPKYLRYRAVTKMVISLDKAVLKITLSGGCANSGAGPNPDGERPALKDLVVAIEVPRRIKAADYDVSKVHMARPEKCTTLP